MATTTDVLVIGAGPTGLMAANLLARNGVRVRIVDKKDSPTEETRAIVMHAKTLELLGKLGLADQAVKEGQKLNALRVLNEGKSARVLSFEGESARTPYPFPLIYTQDQTEHLLIQGLDQTEVRVEWNTELLNMEQAATSTQATIRCADGSQETIEARWIIGADGAHSPVRHTLALGFEGETYKQALFLADVDLEGNLEDSEASIGFMPLGFLAFFPMPGKRRFRAVGVLPLEWKDRDAITVDEVQQVFDTYRDRTIQITKARWISVYRTHHRMCERFRVGHVFLVGDAAHIHSPAGGQGMNTGVGDAYNLAWKLALVIKGQAQPELLDSYEAERMPFARAILNGSDKAFQVQAMSQPFVQQLKMFGIPLLFRLVTSFAPLRQRAFWLVSQLWTSYRTSPAVAPTESGKEGSRAGDRAPYGYFEVGANAGKSVFSLFTDMDHHLLLFAGSRADTTDIHLQEMEASTRSLIEAYAMPIQLHTVSKGNVSLQEAYEVEAPTLFLVRPDGHIAYRGSAQDLSSLRTYLDGLFIKSTQDEYIGGVR
ncbi:FAD-dependent monooxygenase [Ktedonospora formicarum]|uniref:Oxygenase n=1 Tax=Ktedonospora formicarum TaxID=2778364 RepID=A0A8J3I8Q7_9CHLR|nr:FAD-dependent monooxygenase [Ktedonospora formicarum]GHO49283.1 oxygenase [Ktedonospora formicarum]